MNNFPRVVAAKIEEYGHVVVLLQRKQAADDDFDLAVGWIAVDSCTTKIDVLTAYLGEYGTERVDGGPSIRMVAEKLQAQIYDGCKRAAEVCLGSVNRQGMSAVGGQPYRLVRRSGRISDASLCANSRGVICLGKLQMTVNICFQPKYFTPFKKRWVPPAAFQLLTLEPADTVVLRSAEKPCIRTLGSQA